MLSLFLGPLILLLLALFGATALIGFQFGRVVSGEVQLSAYPDLSVIINRKIDHFHRAFALFFKHLGHNLFVLCLLVLRRLTRVSHTLALMAEHKFSRLIEMVRGKGTVVGGKRGSASLFLSSLTSVDKPADTTTAR